LEVTQGHVTLSRTSIERPLERDLSLMKNYARAITPFTADPLP
jgi:hypothetical protein